MDAPPRVVHCRYCGTRNAGGASRCVSCGQDLPDAGPTVWREEDSWFGHFLRMTGVSMLVGLSCYVILGLFWMAHIFSRTGYRKRDFLWLAVPIVGAVVQTRALWRYTARDVYWSPRADRPSDLLRGWQRPWSIALGWLSIPLVVVAGIAAGLADTGWSDQERDQLVEELRRQGLDRPTAECVADGVIDDFPDPDAPVGDGEIQRSMEDAVSACTVELR